MSEPFTARLSGIQPSQLYINSSRLSRVHESIRRGDPVLREPLPVWRHAGRLVLTDGHTRALAAHLLDHETVEVRLDTDDLDWEAYAICVDWCAAEGVFSIADLAKRVVTAEDFERLWLARCRAMNRELEIKRKGGGSA
jgi:hypothetical protein